MIKNIVLLFALIQGVIVFGQNTTNLELTINPGEYWWAGLSTLGFQMPYNATSVFTFDMWGDNEGNQAQPLVLSSNGRYVWSEQPIKYDLNKGKITVTVRDGEIVTGTAGTTLRSAYEFASKKYLPSNGLIPDPLLFTKPQFNTWIELKYDQNEADILKYARAILDNGYAPGVLMVDDNWQEE